jgi:hypothetical protein
LNLVGIITQGVKIPGIYSKKKSFQRWLTHFDNGGERKKCDSKTTPRTNA